MMIVDEAFLSNKLRTFIEASNWSPIEQWQANS